MIKDVKPLLRKFTLRDGEDVEKIGAFSLNENLKIECLGPVLSYLELQDKLIVLLNWYHASSLFNIYRNIFCYSKKDGSLLWQIQQPYDRRDGKPLEEVFKNIKLYTKDNNGELQRYSDPKEYPWDDQVADNTYNAPFRKGVDKLKTMTLGQFPNEYWIDYETGELEWIAIHQKI